MPMTRELKKRFMEIADRLEKVEKRKPIQRTNGEDLDTASQEDVESRLGNIEAVLQIPGDKVGDVQVLSAWRQIIESKLDNIQTVLVMPGEDGFLSGFAFKVDQAITGVKEQVKELHEKWKPLFNVGKWIDKTEGRLTTLEQTPDTQADLTDLKGRVKVLHSAVEEIQLAPDPSRAILEFDDRLTINERRTKSLQEKKLPTPVWMKGIEERVQKLEQIPETPTARQLNSVKERLRGSEEQRHTVAYHENRLKDHHDRLIKLEQKPVAGTLSHIMQEVTLDIEGNSRETKALRSLVLKAIWIVSAILAVMTLAQFLTNVLP